MAITLTTRKKCKRCLLVKIAEQDFYMQGGRYRSICKTCYSANNARNRAANPEKTKAYQKAWRKQNPDYHREWSAANPGKLNEYQRRSRVKKEIAIALDCTPNDTQSSASSNAGGPSGGAKKG
ncbi:hypothetical protein ACFQ3P_13720 [Paraburkholderia sabiae]|uniref:HNH endonuclease n=1 Tax=Paraburkholderia sabiae TaxID=273251 RepID=A0ABU9QD33_9BURK|nr:hypothetical protein [Paraburkholderia sabiae]WJZ76157.1 hypothetical protein QEN71_10260 [Paraburkholderia sabiae]CAD6526105.1 hypothetical protein LMG24235_01919 [Paraburkholderia sabiae]